MADFTFTIPDPILDDVLNSFGKVNGYRDKIDNLLFRPGEAGQEPLIDNPVSKKDFLLQRVIEYIQESSKSNFIEEAITTERKKIKIEVDARIILSAKPTMSGSNEEPLEP